MANQYKIVNRNDSSLCWSNKSGWVEAGFTIFSEKERQDFADRLPLHGEWDFYFKPLTKKIVRQYVKDGGVKCPGCGWSDLEGGFVEVQEGAAFQPMHCTNCGREWMDIYHLVNISIDDHPIL